MKVHSLIHLDPKGPFHLGKQMDMEDTDYMIHSDTVFSALCVISNAIFGEQNCTEFIQPFLEGKPPFLISSIFPCIDTGSKMIYLFPKPLLFKKFINKFPENIKKFKKIRLVSKVIFDAYLNGNEVLLEEEFQDEIGNLIENNLIQGGQVWLSKIERDQIRDVDRLWKINQEPRVRIDRINSETDIFHYSRIFFHKKTKLYFFVQILDGFDKKQILEKLINIFRYLGDTGLGGERSTGSGLFNVSLDHGMNPFSLNLDEGDEKNSQFICLSLFLPKEEEIKKNLITDECYYQIANRQGWITNMTYRRKSINMIEEGSVLNNLNQKSMGNFADVTPELLSNHNLGHAIYRYGYCYPVFFK